MTQTRAIIVAGGMISASLLAHLAYTVNRDRQQAVVAEQTIRLARQEQAWGKAEEQIAGDFRSWLTELIKPDRSHSIKIDFAWVKHYERSDVTWNDARHVTVNGYLQATFAKGDEHGFLWSKKLSLDDEGYWGSDGSTVFTPKDLPKATINSMKVNPIIF